MTKREQNLWFYAGLFIATLAVWFYVRWYVISPQVYDVINDFKTEVIIPQMKEEAVEQFEKTGKIKNGVKKPTKKPQVSAQTRRNTEKANAMQQCSNVTIACMQQLERIARDSAARQSVRSSK